MKWLASKDLVWGKTLPSARIATCIAIAICVGSHDSFGSSENVAPFFGSKTLLFAKRESVSTTQNLLTTGLAPVVVEDLSLPLPCRRT